MKNTLIDNDIALKLSQYSLIDEFCEVSGDPTTIFILPTLKFRFHLKDDTKALTYTKSNEALETLRTFVSSVNEINKEPPDSILAEFSDIDEIDPGEAVLFALTASDDKFLTVTGDKRALQAISKLSTEREVASLLTGRLKCLEQTIAEMLFKCHQPEIVEKITGKEWDTALRICFNSGEIKSIIDGLNSYYCEINKRCGNLLAAFPTS